MRAAVIRAFGAPEVLILAKLPRPAAGPGELLIRVEAAGLNRLDHFIREGSVTDALAFPHVLGSDVVGVVEALGEGVEDFAVGDRVMPMAGHPMDPSDPGAPLLAASRSYGIRGLACPGGYAEFVTAPARWTLRAPANVTAAEAATLPMTVVTGVQALRAVGGVGAGDRVVIHAGASGTGSTMIQIARALGARVAATLRSPDKRDFVEALGAEAALPMGAGFAAAAREWAGGDGPDVVVDNLGGDSIARSLDAVRPTGVVVAMGNVLGLEATIPMRGLFFPQKQIRGSLMGGVEDLRWGLELVAQGRLRPTVDSVFPLERAAAAHARLADGAARGAIALDLAA